MVKILETKDILRLLRKDVEQAGSQSAWSRKTGVDRAVLNRVLSARKAVTKSIIHALNLRTGVYAAHEGKDNPNQARPRFR
jgi:DNA-binding phage protein